MLSKELSIDQQRVWFLLKGPEYYAHKAAEEMLCALNQGKRKRHRAMSKVADEHFETIMQIFSVEQTIRITKTWLSSYHLPLDATKLKSFNQFHATHGEFVINNMESIRSY
jgi:hypothetical protein